MRWLPVRGGPRDSPGRPVNEPPLRKQARCRALAASVGSSSSRRAKCPLRKATGRLRAGRVYGGTLLSLGAFDTRRAPLARGRWRCWWHGRPCAGDPAPGIRSRWRSSWPRTMRIPDHGRGAAGLRRQNRRRRSPFLAGGSSLGWVASLTCLRLRVLGSARTSGCTGSASGHGAGLEASGGRGPGPALISGPPAIYSRLLRVVCKVRRFAAYRGSVRRRITLRPEGISAPLARPSNALSYPHNAVRERPFLGSASRAARAVLRSDSAGHRFASPLGAGPRRPPGSSRFRS